MQRYNFFPNPRKKKMRFLSHERPEKAQKGCHSPPKRWDERIKVEKQPQKMLVSAPNGCFSSLLTIPHGILTARMRVGVYFCSPKKAKKLLKLCKNPYDCLI